MYIYEYLFFNYFLIHFIVQVDLAFLNITMLSAVKDNINIPTFFMILVQSSLDFIFNMKTLGSEHQQLDNMAIYSSLSA